MSAGDDRQENPTQAWTKNWLEFLGRMNAAGFSIPSDGMPPPAAARHMREAFLQAMSAWCDEYLRSPEFLQMMKASMDNAIGLRTQLNEWLSRAYREAHLPAREDIEVLAGRLQSVEKEILARVERIEDRLDAVLKILENRSAVDAAAPAAAREDAPAVRPTRPGARTAKRKSTRR